MKKQIAIVEDEPALRENYAAALARHGYQIKTYGNRKLAMSVQRLTGNLGAGRGWGGPTLEAVMNFYAMEESIRFA